MYCTPLHLGVVAIEKGAFGSPFTTVANFTFTYIYIKIKLDEPDMQDTAGEAGTNS